MALPMARDLERYGIHVVMAPMATIMEPKAQESFFRNLLFPRRLGESREFGQAVKWILECPYVNGETIKLSGAVADYQEGYDFTFYC